MANKADQYLLKGAGNATPENDKFIRIPREPPRSSLSQTNLKSSGELNTLSQCASVRIYPANKTSNKIEHMRKQGRNLESFW